MYQAQDFVNFQCNNVPRMTVREFADEICSRARDVDPDLIGTGLQRIDSDGKFTLHTIFRTLALRLPIVRKN